MSFFLACCSSIVSVPSENYDSRIIYIVIHTTSENYAESLRLLTQKTEYPVSSHYLIPASNDKTYPASDLKIHRLVPEYLRAWHAGVSFWNGKYGLNDTSIGIEIVNEFKCVTEQDESQSALWDLPDVPEQLNCYFPPLSEEQILLVIDLLRDLITRYPDIHPLNIVAHSDIAPTRKSDPGPVFPWKRLYEEGIGAWYDEAHKTLFMQCFKDRLPSIAETQKALNALGYELTENGLLDRETRFALRAFQLHFRPDNFDGKPDLESLAILYALLKKYRPDSIQCF